MLKRKILGALIGISVLAATPVVAAEIYDLPILYASASEVPDVSSWAVSTNDVNKTAVLSAYTGTVTDIQIPSTVTVDDVTYTVTGIGDNTFKAKASIITNVVIPDTVTSIGSNAFYNCAKLTGITIPNSVETIGASAFYGCKLIESITIPDSVETIGASAFYNCTGLKSVTLPSGITKLPEKAFYGCKLLKSINLPDSIITLGDSVFEGCLALTSVNIPTGIIRIPTKAFYNCGLTSVTIPNNVKYIDGYAFAKCASLVKVNVPDASQKDGYITIASTAFDSCPILDFSYFTYTLVTENNNASITGIIGQQTDVILPTKIAGYDVVTTGDNAFSGKTFIESVMIPEGIRTLGAGTFSGCTSLKSVTLPSTLSVISASAFKGCTALEVAPLLDPDPNDDCKIEIVEIGESAFEGCTKLYDVQFPTTLNKIGAKAFYGCTDITTISMPDNIRTLGDCVFQGCTKLSSVQLSNSLRTIPKGAFQGCTALQSIVIPDDVTEIADGIDKFGAFQSSGLKSVTLPERLEKIGKFAFKETPLESVTMKNNVNTLGDSCFEACKSLTSLTLSEGLTAIPSKAFADCSSLMTVVIPDRVTNIMSAAFSCFDTKTYVGNGSLSSVTLPQNLTTIGDNAFAGHSPLKSIELSNTITTIGAGAFRCTGLTKVVLPTNAKYTILNRAVFSDCPYLSEVTIPENVTSIADGGSTLNDGTFYACVSLESIKLPSKLTKIGSDAFAHCVNLGEIVIPDLVTSVGNYAFYDCSAMNKVKIGAKVQTLGAYAFEHCLALPEIEIPSTVKTLGAGLFSACTNLKKLTTNADLVNNASQDESAYEILFYSDSKICLDTYYSGDQNLVNHALEEVVFNSGVTTIGDYSFGGASELQRINIANTVNRIGEEAFYNCKELVFVSTIPRSVIEISDYAFSGCPNLKAIVIPKTVTTFGSKVFAGDTSLTIFGESGSAAETYANNDNEDIPFVNIYQNIKNAKAVSTGTGVSLSWDKISDTIVANGQTYKIDKIVYHIYRTGPDGVKTTIADVENNSYVDNNVTLGSTYSYAINCSYCFTAKNGEEYTIESSEINVGKVTVSVPKPTNVRAIAGNGNVTVTWNAVPGATKYLIKNGGSTVLASNLTGTIKMFTGLNNGTTYKYTVYACVGGKWSSASAVVSATPSASIVTKAPDTVNAIAGNGNVTVIWNEVPGAVKYIIKNGGSTVLASDLTGTSKMFTGLTNGKTYKYTVYAYVNGKWSAASSVASATPSVSIVTKAPDTVTAVAGNGSVTLTWSAVPGAVKYLIKDGGSTVLASNITETTKTFTGLTNGTTYKYMVYAYVNGEWSGASKVVSATPNVSIIPQNVKAVADDKQITVSWDAVPGATKYLIKNGGSTVLASNLTGTSKTFTGLTNGTTYKYTVFAYVNGKWSGASAIVSAIPGDPTIPQNVKAVAGDKKVTVSWGAVPGATKYLIKDGGSTVLASNLTETSKVFTELSNGTTYKYTVYAYVNGKWSGASEKVSATPGVYTVPQNVKAVAGDKQVTVSWDALEGATKYLIKDGGTTILASSITGTSKTFTGLSNGTTYKYTVYAYVNGKWSGASKTVSATPSA